jgi:DNA polymerase-3 subunit alpha
MQFIDDFIGRKHGNRTIVYPHPSMEPALKNTYGVLVYQEQVMQISKEVCGFTGGEADTLRKAIGKKNIDMMRKMREKMISGAQEKSGIDEALMEKFWKQLEDFAAYCFNKSHAACYGLIAYQTAYLKAHYPSAFMAALMTSDYDDTDRLAIEINECKHMGVEVLPPDINESFLEFAVVPKTNQIRFGMLAIKNVGSGAVEEIIRARQMEGHFTSLEDVLAKVNVHIANKKALESLVRAGAFDRFGDRSILYNNLEVILAYANRLQKEANSGQTDLFGNAIDDAGAMAPRLILSEAGTRYEMRDQLQWERELLGIYISQHPLEVYRAFLEEQTVPLTEIKPEHDGKSTTVGGIITDVREITTKNGKKMAFIKLADLASEIELILFPNSYQQTIGTWEKDKIVLVSGKVNAKERDGTVSTEAKLMVDDAREITPQQAASYQATGRKRKAPTKSKKVAKAVPAPVENNERVYIRVLDSNDQNTLMQLKQTIDDHQGDTEVVLVLGQAEKKQIIKLPMRIARIDASLDRLRLLVGDLNVKVQ